MHVLFHYDLYDDLKKTLFIKIHERNTLFTNYNNHDKLCFFFFNNTDSHISRLLLISFFKHLKLKDERNVINNTINYTIHQLHFCFLNSI